MIKLAIFDVDGTLVTKGSRRILASCVHVPNKLSREGVKLAIVSDRPPLAMEQNLLEQVSFDYLVCSNGIFVRNIQHEVFYHYSFTMEGTRSLIRAFKETDNALMLQRQDAAHCCHGYKRVTNTLQNLLGQLDTLVDERESGGYLQDTMPLAAVTKIESAGLNMMKQRSPQFLLTPFDTYFYDTDGAHDRVTGVSYMREAMGWSMQDVTSPRDGYNDLETIKAYGIDVVIGDAREAVKEAADYVSGLCSRNGIAQAFLHYGLTNRVYDGETISE